MVVIFAVWSREACGEFNRIPRLTGSEAHEIVQEDDVLEADGKSLQEQLELREAIDGEC